MPTNGIRNLAYDGTCTNIRHNLSKIGGMTKFTPPEMKKKQEVIALLGESWATVRTPGVMDLMTCTSTFTAVGWKEAIVKLGDRYMELEFPITTTERHVQVTGGYSTILDRCQIVGVKGTDHENTEKARLIEVTYSVIMVHERGANGVWITPIKRPGESFETSPAARALMF